MLEYLRIRDLALIEDVELEFSAGMNVLTGETGAGKTFILKAIQFVLGEKLTTDMVRAGAEKAQVEAVFVLKDVEYQLRRELIAETGRSRFFLNGDLSSQDTIRQLRPSLILHVGQHGQQRLLQSSFQGQLVDSFLDDDSLIAQKEKIQKKIKALAEEKQALIDRVEHLKDRRELLEMQQKEIEKVNPQKNEEDRLEELRSQIRNSEHLEKAYEEGLEILFGSDSEGLLTNLGRLEKVLYIIRREDKAFDPSYDAILNFQEDVKDLSARLRSFPVTDKEHNLDAIESRLYALAQLKRKLNRSLEQILEMQEEITENLSFLDICSLDIQQFQKQEEEYAKNLYTLLESLNIKRELAAQNFCDALIEELKGLGFSERVRVEPEFIPTKIWNAVGQVPACIENKVRLLWAPNPGQAPQLLDKIASGGELSRFLLAVASLQQSKVEEASFIFDEVDSGVGGLTLNKIADRLENLASHRQMLLITHWPQLAVRGQRHFLITKESTEEQTFTRCIQLDDTAREKELSRMLGQE